MIKKLILNKQLSIGIILLLVLGAVLVFPTAASETVDSPFGEWQVSITATDEEGNIKPLSVVNNMLGQLLSISVDGQEVTDFTFTLKAKATGEGYDSCEIDMSNAYIATSVGGVEYASGIGESGIEIPVNGDFQTVFSMSVATVTLESLVPGSHTLTFSLKTGDYKFRGVPDGEWQTSTSIPTASIQIEKTEEQKTCYKCDGNGGVSTTSVGESQNCPSGYQSSPPSCSCSRETSYGSWSSWEYYAPSCNCFVIERRTRDKLERTCCPGGGCSSWSKWGTDEETRDVYDEDYCQEEYIMCYQCDGNGGMNSKEVLESVGCGSGWSSSYPSCPCTTETSYSSWGPWVFQNCLPGRLRHDMRERSYSTQTCCPSASGMSCDGWAQGGMEYEHRYVVDWGTCFWYAQFVVPSLTFNVQTTPFDSYQTDSSHYLGKL